MIDLSTAVSVEYQITRTHLARLDPFSALCLGSGIMRKGDSEVLHDGHCKSGAVRSLCEARSAPYIRISKEFHRVVYDPAP